MNAKHLIFIVAVFLIMYGVRLGLECLILSGGPAADIATKLDSPDPATVVQGFHRLTRKADPVAVPRALELLESPDESIWLNAAHYLGACKRTESVPYLIKALRHTSRRSDATTATYLKDVTGQDFGSDFVGWQDWWRVQPGHRRGFDWSSRLGHAPRIQATSRKR